MGSDDDHREQREGNGKYRETSRERISKLLQAVATARLLNEELDSQHAGSL